MAQIVFDIVQLFAASGPPSLDCVNARDERVTRRAGDKILIERLQSLGVLDQHLLEARHALTCVSQKLRARLQGWTVAPKRARGIGDKSGDACALIFKRR